MSRSENQTEVRLRKKSIAPELRGVDSITMKKILIVDDELLVRKALGRLFSQMGYQVREAQDGQEGLAVWLEFYPDFAFVDIMMPQMTGFELLNQIRNQGLSLKNTYVMSAFHQEQEWPYRHEVAGWLEKPFTNLFAIKDLLLQPKAPMTPS